MIYSMTGFGRARREVDGLGLEIEVRSVNHRHLDLRVRLPRILADQESALKKRIQAGLSRGVNQGRLGRGAGQGPAPGPPAEGGSVNPVFLVETGGSRTPRPEDTPLECATGLSGD